MTREKSQNILLDTLVSQGKIAEKERDRIIQKYAKLPDNEKNDWGKILRQEKAADDIDIAKAYAQILNFPFIYLSGKVVPFKALQSLPEDICRRYLIFPYEKKENIIKLAVANPSRLKSSLKPILKKIEEEKKIRLELAVTPYPDWQKAMQSYQKLKDLNQLEKSAIPRHILEQFPYDVARQYKMVVYDQPSANTIKVAAVNPDDPAIKNILDFIKDKNNLNIEVKKAQEREIESALMGYKEYRLKEEIKETQPKIDNKIDSKRAENKAIEKQVVHNTSQDDKSEKDIKKSIEEVPEVLSSELPEKARQEIEGIASDIKKAQEEELEEKNLDQFLGKDITALSELREIVKQAQITKIVASILSLAIHKKASDVHIEAQESALRLRYRVDGILEDILRLPVAMHAPIVSRIKILAKLKIDEKRIPQDGRFRVATKGREVDLRISTLPTVYGEKAVMRLLDKSRGVFSLEELGVVGQPYRLLVKNIEKPHGIILVTGPTGSGKSTTLYAILNRLSTPEINIVTLEDPIEYEIEGVNQCQIRPKIGFGFAEGLRSILRQDPNIIMVGEVRDGETASMVTHAALTGHLVLTTLHTNDAAGALPRLINMGIEPFLITSSINLIIAQRLVRRLCPICRVEQNPPSELVKEVQQEMEKLRSEQKKEVFGSEEVRMKFYTASGCGDCNQGYSGRIGIYEVLPMDEKIEELATNNSSSNVIAAKAIEGGMITIKQDGYTKVLKGITSLDEVMRVTSEGE